MSKSYFKTTVLPELLDCTLGIRKCIRLEAEEKAKQQRRGLAHQDMLFAVRRTALHAARRTGPDREYGNLIQCWKVDERISYGYDWYVSERDNIHNDPSYIYGLEKGMSMREKRTLRRLFHYQSLIDELYNAYVEAASRPPQVGGPLYEQTKQHYDVLPHFDE